MKKKFESILASDLVAFVQFKQKLGYKYNASSRSHLIMLDRLAIEHKLKIASITQTFSEQCLAYGKSRSLSIAAHLMGYLRRFSIFLRDQGITTFVPDLPSFKIDRTPMPHIYDQDQISRILKACDSLRILFGADRKRSIIICMPGLVRLLISTGIRISEAINLKLKDVDLEKRVILVIDSKNGRERLLPISVSLNEALKLYADSRQKFCLKKVNANFFISLGGSNLRTGSVYYQFLGILKKAGVSSPENRTVRD